MDNPQPLSTRMLQSGGGYPGSARRPGPNHDHDPGRALPSNVDVYAGPGSHTTSSAGRQKTKEAFMDDAAAAIEAALGNQAHVVFDKFDETPYNQSLEKATRALAESQRREKAAVEALMEATKRIDSLTKERDTLQSDLNKIKPRPLNGNARAFQPSPQMTAAADSFMNRRNQSGDIPMCDRPIFPHSEAEMKALDPTRHGSGTFELAKMHLDDGREVSPQPQPPAASAHTDDHISAPVAGIHLGVNARGSRGRGQRGRGRGGGRGGRGGCHVQDSRCQRCVQKINKGDFSYEHCDLDNGNFYPCNNCQIDGKHCQYNGQISAGLVPRRGRPQQQGGNRGHASSPGSG